MFRKIVTFAMIALALGAAFVLTDRTPAFAATTYVVTSNADLDDADTGDPACKSSNGSCTLRAAIKQANAQAGSETIELKPNTTYSLSAGYLNINSDLVVKGAANAVVDAGGNSVTGPVFHAEVNHQVTLQDLTVRGGTQGGIMNRASLTLDRVTVQDNSWTGNGGGIINLGTVLLNDSTVRDNTAAQRGGGLDNQGTALIFNSTFNGNAATDSHGGAIYNDEGAKLTLVNSTLSGNRAGDHGGAIFNHKQGEAQLFNVTIAQNKADQDNDGAGDGGGMYNNDGPLGMSHTLIAYNMLENGQIDTPNDCGGFFVSNGHNLVRVPGTCVIIGEDTNGIGLDPKLGPLGDNGGNTMTHALLQGSQAIDLGNPGSCPGPGGFNLARDQRDYTRIVDGNGVGGVLCDAGAIEYGSTPLEPPACAGKPDKATVHKPINGAEVTTVRVRLNWNDVPCADFYKVRVRQDGKHGPTVDKDNDVPESKYKTAELEPGHTYYVRVLACNQAGCSRSPFSTVIVNP